MRGCFSGAIEKCGDCVVGHLTCEHAHKIDDFRQNCAQDLLLDLRSNAWAVPSAGQIISQLEQSHDRRCLRQGEVNWSNPRFLVQLHAWHRCARSNDAQAHQRRDDCRGPRHRIGGGPDSLRTAPVRGTLQLAQFFRLLGSLSFHGIQRRLNTETGSPLQ